MIEIKKLYAFVAVNKGREEIVHSLGIDPLIFQNKDTAEGMRDVAAHLSKSNDIEIRLVEFERKEGFEVVK